MSTNEREYIRALVNVMNYGERRPDRTGTGVRSLFGERMVFDLNECFPLLTTKRIHWKSVVGELLWFINGGKEHSMSARALRERYGVTIWDEWADEDGELGPIYGVQWREWLEPTVMGAPIAPFCVVDQLADVIRSIKRDPYSRRHVVTAWNPGELDDMALPPCHVLFQFYVSTDGRLSCHMYQRSADIFLGVPFNIASYALLTHMVAHVTGLGVGRLVISFGDLHLYENHVEQAIEQAARRIGDGPGLKLDPNVRSIDDFTPERIHLLNYFPQGAIKAQVAV